MPRYFFHSTTIAGKSADAEGVELSDDDAAICEAGHSAGQMLADDLVEGCLFQESHIRVEADGRRLVAIISVKAKVQRPHEG